MKYTYRCEWVRCGKGCSGCPHGPYWYAYWRETGKLRKRYLGKDRAKAEHEQAQEPTIKPPEVVDPHDAIFARSTASLSLAWAILGLPSGTAQDVARKTYRRLQLEHHPDRGGVLKRAMQLNCAWEYIRSVFKWH